MKIELDLNQMLGFEYDEETGEPIGQKDFRHEVVQAVAGKILDQTRSNVAAQAAATVNETIQSEIRDIVRAAMEDPIQKRTPWGERQGEPQTILEMVRTSLEKFLSSTTGGRDPYGNRKPENLAQLIDEVTREVLSKELREDVAEAKKQINAAIQDRAVKAAVESLTLGVKVR